MHISGGRGLGPRVDPARLSMFPAKPGVPSIWPCIEALAGFRAAVLYLSCATNIVLKPGKAARSCEGIGLPYADRADVGVRLRLRPPRSRAAATVSDCNFR